MDTTLHTSHNFSIVNRAILSSEIPHFICTCVILNANDCSPRFIKASLLDIVSLMITKELKEVMTDGQINLSNLDR